MYARLGLLLVLTLASSNLPAQMAAAPAGATSASMQPGPLTREQAGAIIPATVFYKGQTATTQARNSAGIKLPDGRLVLFALVDNSGYSTAVRQTYQAYLITETTLMFGGKSLPAGAYGFGFLADGRAVVMDIGGKELLSAATKNDSAMKRPTPLQLLAAPEGKGQYRLYLGRAFLSVAPAS